KVTACGVVQRAGLVSTVQAASLTFESHCVNDNSAHNAGGRAVQDAHKANRADQETPELEEEEEVGGSVEVMRRHLPLSQRERKAGCRNFFWKTFTSC
uniref:Somatostatin/Cortistatin C-terminal domain-containing protein n=1 Tax=Scophthalmus maximus TaxID=52904 RepID=A0A8D3A7U3_SCOMX